MKQRGRKSASSLVTVSEVGLGPMPPPAGLTQAERGVWLTIVNGRPADYFGIEHGPLMVEYCRHVCRSHVIAGQLAAIDEDVLATPEGLVRYEKLTGMAAKVAQIIKVLATAMRLTHSAVYSTKAAALAEKPQGKIWQRDEEQLKAA